MKKVSKVQMERREFAFSRYSLTLLRWVRMERSRLDLQAMVRVLFLADHLDMLTERPIFGSNEAQQQLLTLNSELMAASLESTLLLAQLEVWDLQFQRGWD